MRGGMEENVWGGGYGEGWVSRISVTYLERLAGLADAPDPYEALRPSADNLGAVRGAGNGCHGLLMCVVDGVYELPTLRPKRADLAVTPPADHRLAILGGEGDKYFRAGSE